MGGFQHQRDGGRNGRLSNGVPAGATPLVSVAQQAARRAQRPMDDMPLAEPPAGLRQNRGQVTDLTLDLLASEANQRYAQHLRLAYEALVEVERERGLYYGNTLSDMLADCLEQAEREVYGPKGLLGAE